MLIIDKTARISPLADVEDSIRGTTIRIGEFSVIDAFVKIKPAGGIGHISIGNHCYINSGCTLYTGNGITIGNNVMLAANVVLAPTNHGYQSRKTPIRLQGYGPSKGGIRIDDDVWIGSNASILDGSVIGTGCVIGAGSTVRTSLEPYGIYVGNPVRLIGERT
jgi:virginiamycin A acetyltransferase